MPAVTSTKTAFGGVAAGHSDLGNTQNSRPTHKSPSPDGVLELRQELYRVKSLLWDRSTLKRVRTCGKKPRSTAVTIKTGGKGKSAGFGNLETCGSLSACPTCSKKISAVRADEIGRAITSWCGKGNSVGFFTFTLRHFAGMDLQTTWEGGLQKAWSSIISSRKYKIEIKDRYDIVGYIRVVEVTTGENGWHPHIHCLFFFDGKKSQDQVSDLGAEMFNLWSSALVKQCFPAPLRIVKQEDGSTKTLGVDARLVVDASLALGQYFSKSIYPLGSKTYEANKTGLEMALGGISKFARFGNATPFQLLKYFSDTGDSFALELWQEWERVSKGKRIHLWSNGLRKLLDLPIMEKTDEQIASEDEAGEILVCIPSKQWALLVRFRVDLLPKFLYLAEVDATGIRLKRFLNASGVIWFDPKINEPVAFG